MGIKIPESEAIGEEGSSILAKSILSWNSILQRKLRQGAQTCIN